MKNKWLKVACVAVAVAAVAASANAVPEFSLIIDGTTVDSVAPTPLALVSDAGVVGDWSIVYAHGTLVNPSPLAPVLDLGTLDVTTTSAGVLTIEVLYSGVGPLGSYINLPSGSVSGDITYSFDVIHTSSEIGILATLTSTGAGSASLDDTLISTPAPDGGLTVGLLGLALAGVEGLRRKLRK